MTTLADRRRYWAAALLCLLALVASGCGSEGTGEVADDIAAGQTETTATATATATDGEAASAPAAGQELVVGVDADPWVDASEEDRKRRPSYPINADVCETLVHLGTDFQVEPMIATEWEYIGDNTFRFTIRDDVTFSDGTPVDAEAVKYSLDYTAQDPNTAGFSFIGPDSTKVVDEYTVEVTPTEPNLRLVEQINHPTYSIMKPGSDPLNDPMVTCTGPFQVAEYVPSERLVVERNPNYWGEPARLERITFRFFADATTRSLALQNGEVDMITDVPRGILTSLAELPGVEIEEAPIGQVRLMYVARRDAAGSDKPLADPLVRRAVAAAIDQEAFVEGVLAGYGEVVAGVAPPAVLGEHADLVQGIPYDPEEANRLLDEAGWARAGDGVRTKDGQPLELDIVYARVELIEAEFVQAQLAEVGIQANVLQLDAGAYRDRLDTGDYDLDLSLPNQNDANPAFLLSLRWYSKATGENAQWIAPGPDTEFERLIDQTQAATDPDELQRLAAEATHVLIDEEVGAIPLAGTAQIFALSEDIEGFQPHPSGTNQRWATVSIGE